MDIFQFIFELSSSSDSSECLSSENDEEQSESPPKDLCFIPVKNEVESDAEGSISNSSTVEKNMKIEPGNLCGLQPQFIAGKTEKLEKMAKSLKTKTYRCKECEMRFENVDDCICHSRSVHSIKKTYIEPSNVTRAKKLKKKQSTFSYAHSNHLKKLSESVMKGKTLTCDTCKMLFKTNASYKLHQEKIHAAPIKLKCKLCEFTDDSFAAVMLHQLQAHNESTSPTLKKEYPIRKCSHCDFTTSVKLKLSRHMHDTHGIKIYKCDTCGSRFATENTLAQHIKFIHSDERPYSCDVCGYTCKRFGALTCHMKQHNTSMTNICSECNKSFTTANALRIHKVIHTPVEQRRLHFCKFCPAKYTTYSAFCSHMSCSHKDRRYPCDMCGYVSHTRYRLKRHMQTHAKPDSELLKGRNRKYMCDNGIP